MERPHTLRNGALGSGVTLNARQCMDNDNNDCCLTVSVLANNGYTVTRFTIPQAQTPPHGLAESHTPNSDDRRAKGLGL